MLKVFSQMYKETVCTEEERIGLYHVIDEIVSLANCARRNGVLALEESAQSLDPDKDFFLQTGIMLIVDGTDPELVEDMLETLIIAYDGSERCGADLLKLIIQADGLLSIQAGENPRLITSKLSAYLGLNFVRNQELMTKLQNREKRDSWDLKYVGRKMEEYMAAVVKSDSTAVISALSNDVIIGLMMCVEDGVAADMLTLLSRERQAVIIKEMMKGNAPNPKVIIDLFNNLAQILVDKPALDDLGKCDRVKRIAKILFAMRHTDEKSLLWQLEGIDGNGEYAELVDKIREARMDFDDLEKLSDRALQTVVAYIDAKRLVVACKGASPVVVAKIKKNLSAGRCEQFEMDSKDMGPVRSYDAEEARRHIVSVARRLEDSGEIIIPRRKDDFVC